MDFETLGVSESPQCQYTITLQTKKACPTGGVVPCGPGFYSSNGLAPCAGCSPGISLSSIFPSPSPPLFPPPLLFGKKKAANEESYPRGGVVPCGPGFYPSNGLAPSTGCSPGISLFLPPSPRPPSPIPPPLLFCSWKEKEAANEEGMPYGWSCSVRTGLYSSNGRSPCSCPLSASITFSKDTPILWIWLRSLKFGTWICSTLHLSH